MSAGMRHAAPRLRRRAEAGGPAAVRVLLLHGMAGGPSGWNALASRLPAWLELWDVKLPWAFTGDPDWARDRDVTQWVTAPVEHLRRRAGGGPDVIVAHSFAANVVLELLARSDVLASTPAALVSPFYREAGTNLDWRSVISSMEGCYLRIDDELTRKHGTHGNDLVREIVSRQIRRLAGFYPRLRFHELFSRTTHLDLESLDVPMLLVGGSDDPGATARSVRLLADRIPQARLEILDGCGHFPMTEHAARLAEHLTSFIDAAIADQAMPSHQQTGSGGQA